MMGLPVVTDHLPGPLTRGYHLGSDGVYVSYNRTDAAPFAILALQLGHAIHEDVDVNSATPGAPGAPNVHPRVTLRSLIERICRPGSGR